jgi:hypothetical protein
VVIKFRVFSMLCVRLKHWLFDLRLWEVQDQTTLAHGVKTFWTRLCLDILMKTLTLCLGGGVINSGLMTIQRFQCL